MINPWTYIRFREARENKQDVTTQRKVTIGVGNIHSVHISGFPHEGFCRKGLKVQGDEEKCDKVYWEYEQ
jgi:hypothetical protein